MKILKLYVDVELVHTILVSFIYVHLCNNKEIFFIILLYSTGQVVCLFLSSTSCQRFALYKTYRQNLFNFHRHILYIEYISVLIKRNYIHIHQIPTQELKHSGKSITNPPPPPPQPPTPVGSGSRGLILNYDCIHKILLLLHARKHTYEFSILPHKTEVKCRGGSRNSG